MEKYKRKWGDKKDARLIKGDELDTNHFVMPLVWPRRTDNEAFITDVIDMTAVDAYIEKYNENNELKLSVFIMYLAAVAKAFINRPKMNRFYRNGRLYERYRFSIGFIVKKSLTDDAPEALARVYFEPEDTLTTFAKKITDEIEKCRKPQLDKSSDDLRILMKFPHFIGKIVLGFMRWWDKKTCVPESVSASDLFFCTIVISHLGSIGLHSGYHHLSNWGTNSFFTTLGQKKVRPFNDKDGTVTYKDSIDYAMTIDERIVDGLYYSKTIRLMNKYLANPEILEKPFKD